MNIKQISVKDIVLDEEFNSRDAIQFNTVIDLAKSIEKDGLIQPIVVKEIPDGKYQVIAGHRRTKAFLVLCNNDPKFNTISAVIRNDLSPIQERVMNLNENLARKDLDIMEEALAILPLFEMGMTEQQMVDSIPSASRGWIQIRMMLMKLPKEIQEEVAAKKITQTHIRELYTMQHAGMEKDALFEQVRKAKDAKARGEAYRITTKKAKVKTPSQQQHNRNRTEIFVMMKHIREAEIKGLHLRCLAWAAGEISDLDLFCDLRDESPDYVVQKEGLDYAVKV